MADDLPGPEDPTPGVPPFPGAPAAAWPPAVAPRPGPRPPVRQRSWRGCGSSLAVLVGIAVVLGALVFAVQWKRENSPAHRRAERIDDLRAVCEGNGIDGVPSYRRTATPALGARFDPTGDEIDDHTDTDVVAFALVPGSEADPDAVLDARLMACTTSRATESETCSFNDITKAPSFSGGGNVTAEWTTRTTTELRIVDIHSGKVLKTRTFETSSECPTSLRVEDDGSYESGLPLQEIADQTEAQLALFHQG